MKKATNWMMTKLDLISRRNALGIDTFTINYVLGRSYSGRSTSVIFRTIAIAMENPGKWVETIDVESCCMNEVDIYSTYDPDTNNKRIFVRIMDVLKTLGLNKGWSSMELKGKYFIQFEPYEVDPSTI